MRRGSGGLISALITVAEATSAAWVACARTPAERERATTGLPVSVSPGEGAIRVYYANPNPDAYRRYYSVIANPLLFVFGLAATLVRARTGSTLNSFAMHATQNTMAVVATYALLSGAGA